MSWTTINLLRVPEERKSRRLVNQAFKAQLGPVLAVVRDSDTLSGIASAAFVAIDPAPMEAAILKTYTSAGVKFAKHTRSKLKATKAADPNFEQWFQRMRTFARTRAGQRVLSINDTTTAEARRIIGDAVEQAALNGWGALEAASYIESKFTGMAFYRAEMIARTEVLTASNEGSLEGARSLDVPFTKVWIATTDDRTRDSHKDMNGKEAPDGSVFDNGLEYPGDPNGTAGEVINCRCAIGYNTG